MGRLNCMKQNIKHEKKNLIDIIHDDRCIKITWASKKSERNT